MPTAHTKKNNYKTNNDLMARGLLQMLRESGGEPDINKLELSRCSRVPYIVVKEHCKRGFITANAERIAAEFRTAAADSDNPRILAARLLSCVEKNAVWFAIESARKSYFLWEQLTEAIRDQLTVNWSEQNPAKQDELYRLFCGKFFQIVQAWIKSNCSDESAAEYEIRLAKLLNACADGQVNTAIFC